MVALQQTAHFIRGAAHRTPADPDHSEKGLKGSWVAVAWEDLSSSDSREFPVDRYGPAGTRKHTLQRSHRRAYRNWAGKGRPGRRYRGILADLPAAILLPPRKRTPVDFIAGNLAVVTDTAWSGTSTQCCRFSDQARVVLCVNDEAEVIGLDLPDEDLVFRGGNDARARAVARRCRWR